MALPTLVFGRRRRRCDQTQKRSKVHGRSSDSSNSGGSKRDGSREPKRPTRKRGHSEGIRSAALVFVCAELPDRWERWGRSEREAVPAIYHLCTPPCAASGTVRGGTGGFGPRSLR